jgi:tetratricopeptide (TPR) repeat protein
VSTLESLHKRLRGLPLKRPGFAVALHGEAGIGKTYAVRSVLQSAPCVHLSLHATASLSVLARGLPKSRGLPQWAAAVLEKLERGAFVEDAIAIDAVAGALQNSAPFILHLEDVHETAPERLEWLGKLADAVRRARGVAFIVTSRQASPDNFEVLRLEPLTQPETRAMLEAEIGATLPEECLEWIQGKAAGNPLFTLEFFRHLARQGFAWNDGKRWHWRSPPDDTMPVSVEALIERLLMNAAHTATLEAVLQATALLPDDAETDLRASIADVNLETLEVASASLRSEGVFTAHGFVHPLYREVIRQRLSARHTETLAQRAVTWLRSHAPERAVDFIELARLEPRLATELFEFGIAKLREDRRAVEAALLQHRSLRFRSGEDRARAALEALRTLHDVDFNLSSALLEEAVRGEQLESADIAFLGEQLAQRGRETDGLALLERLPESERSDARMLEWRVRLCTLAGNPRLALELVDAHPELLHSQQPEVIQRLVHALATAGRGAEALEAGLRGLGLPVNPAERVNLLQTIAIAHLYQGQALEAVNLWSQALELARAHDLDAGAMKIIINRAQALNRLGEKAQAEADLELASKLARQYGDRRVYAQSLVLLGVVLTERGAFERAEDLLLEALSTLEDGRTPDLRLNSELALTELYRVWASPHGQFLMHKYARQALEHAKALNTPIFLLSAYIGLSSAELRIGNPKRALELADETLELARQHGRHFQAMSAVRCRAAALERLGDTSAAITAWREAVTLAQSLNLPLHAQENQLEVDHLTHDLDGARERLAWFEVQGHPLEAATARRYFPELDTNHDSGEHEDVPRLEVLGAMRLNGVPVRGRKRQELLAALLEARIAGRAEVTKLELLDRLYPDSDEDQGGNALKETVRLVRQTLGSSVIQTTANGYTLGVVQSDVERFLETPDATLWRGAYLGDLNTDDTVRETVHLALYHHARALLPHDPKATARVARLLLEYDPYNLEFVRLSLEALRASDNHKSLGRLYTEARGRMAEVGETLPERWQSFLETP